eukprot:scaffold62361_cov24-Tisochrysis_lutea.AAC.2
MQRSKERHTALQSSSVRQHAQRRSLGGSTHSLALKISQGDRGGWRLSLRVYGVAEEGRRWSLIVHGAADEGWRRSKSVHGTVEEFKAAEEGWRTWERTAASACYDDPDTYDFKCLDMRRSNSQHVCG